MLKKKIKRKLKENFSLGSSPDFLVIGAQKAGTTSLFNYLVEYGKNFTPPSERLLRLPLWYGMTINQAKKVTETVRKNIQ
jgi:dTDP-4-amino-4,6-dideoxygalactose transaminase